MFGVFGGENGNNPFGGGGFGFGGVQPFPQRFDEHYRCYPVSFCDKAHLETGDKIVLPPSALDTLARLHIDYPMLFELKNESANRRTHCGVMEFSAPEGSCYMPYWMMQNLFTEEGGMLRIQNATLHKANFVKLRPQSTDFLNISNPRVVLEGSLRKFSCMTVGDTICLPYNDKNYFLDVREVKPEDAACIIETDCEVDFELPADYVPRSKQAPGMPVAAPSINSFSFASCPLGTRGGLRMNTKAASNVSLASKGNSSTDPAALRAACLRKYEAFYGVGRSLNGAAYEKKETHNVVPGSALPQAPTAVAQAIDSGAEEKNDSASKESKQVMLFRGEGRRLR